MVNTDPQQVLREAAILAREGRHEEALQKYLWFHDNALAINPYLSGVRLSFALAYWVELGHAYLPARDALVAVRDEKAATLTSGRGTRSLFADVAAINHALEDERATTALFVRLRQSDPGLAADCYPDAEEALVAAGRFDLCSDYLPDPVATADRSRQLRREAHAMPLPTGPHEDIHRQTTETIFATRIGHLVAILTGVGRVAEADRVRDLALAETDSPDLRAALDAATGPGTPRGQRAGG